MITNEDIIARHQQRGDLGNSYTSVASQLLPCTSQTGKPCPVCGDTVREVSFADSSLQYCATCQTGGKPLADRRTSKFLK